MYSEIGKRKRLIQKKFIARLLVFYLRKVAITFFIYWLVLIYLFFDECLRGDSSVFSSGEQPTKKFPWFFLNVFISLWLLLAGNKVDWSCCFVHFALCSFLKCGVVCNCFHRFRNVQKSNSGDRSWSIQLEWFSLSRTRSLFSSLFRAVEPTKENRCISGESLCTWFSEFDVKMFCQEFCAQQKRLKIWIGYVSSLRCAKRLIKSVSTRLSMEVLIGSLHSLCLGSRSPIGVNDSIQQILLSRFGIFSKHCLSTKRYLYVKKDITHDSTLGQRREPFPVPGIGIRVKSLSQFHVYASRK